ncbi:MAG: SpoIID/LytB domain-containing protein [Planctomycetes bacterium]|nr:SpoIID/LytB domain-containing protein [Planctomycetota bacterium]
MSTQRAELTRKDIAGQPVGPVRGDLRRGASTTAGRCRIPAIRGRGSIGAGLLLAAAAVLLGAAALAASCRRRPGGAGVPGIRAEQAGPEIRIIVRSAPSLVVGFQGSVQLHDPRDWSLLFRGKLPFPTEVRLRGERVEIAGQLVPSPVRILTTGDPEAGGGGETSGESASRGGPGRPSAPPPGAAEAGGAGPRGGSLLGSLRAESGGISGERGGGSGSTRRIPEVEMRVEGFRPSFLVASADPQDAVSRYRGALELRAAGGRIEAVNALRLEEYLAGVIGAELPASSPIEALKAQAVCARTYALHSLRRAEERGASTDFTADTRFQVYRGVEAEHPQVFRAIAATRGEVLTYLEKMFRSYYHSTCGGQTAQASLHLSEPDIPPLGGVSCPWCAGSRLASWTSVWPAALMERIAKARLDELRPGAFEPPLRGVEVARFGSDGRALYLRVEHSGGDFEWRADAFREQCRRIAPEKKDPVWSTFFEIFRDPGSGDYILKGRGWGHGIGLCQVGCARMGREKSCREILAFYYPRSEIGQAY